MQLGWLHRDVLNWEQNLCMPHTDLSLYPGCPQEVYLTFEGSALFNGGQFMGKDLKYLWSVLLKAGRVCFSVLKGIPEMCTLAFTNETLSFPISH